MGLTQTHMYYCFSNAVIHKIESKHLTKLQPLCESVCVGLALAPCASSQLLNSKRSKVIQHAFKGLVIKKGLHIQTG